MRAVIFDMDGVLVNSEPVHVAIEKEIFEDLGISFRDEEIHQFIGTTNTEMWGMIKVMKNLDQSSSELAKLSIERKTDMMKAMDLEPIDGIRQLVDHLKLQGYKLAVASSSPMVHIELILEKFGMRHLFNAVASGEEVPKGKPAPDVFLEAARQLEVPAELCTVIEDSSHGITAAKAAGMSCIGYDNVHSEGQSYDHADAVVQCIGDIIALGLV